VTRGDTELRSLQAAQPPPGKSVLVYGAAGSIGNGRHAQGCLTSGALKADMTWSAVSPTNGER
jgi:hypothetical protein